MDHSLQQRSSSQSLAGLSQGRAGANSEAFHLKCWRIVLKSPSECVLILWKTDPLAFPDFILWLGPLTLCFQYIPVFKAEVYCAFIEINVKNTMLYSNSVIVF